MLFEHFFISARLHETFHIATANLRLTVVAGTFGVVTDTFGVVVTGVVVPHGRVVVATTVVGFPVVTGGVPVVGTVVAAVVNGVGVVTPPENGMSLTLSRYISSVNLLEKNPLGFYILK